MFCHFCNIHNNNATNVSSCLSETLTHYRRFVVGRVTYADRWIGKGCGGRGWRWMYRWCSCHRVHTLVLWVCALDIIYTSIKVGKIYGAAKLTFLQLQHKILQVVKIWKINSTTIICCLAKSKNL